MLKRILFVLFCLSAVPVSAQQLVEGVAAVVGKEVILRSEVDNYTQQYIVQNRIDVQQDPSAIGRLKQQTLNFLIEQKLLVAKAEEDTVTVDEIQLDQLVDQRIKFYMDRVGSEDELEKIFGKPLKKIRKEIRDIVREEEVVKRIRAEKFTNVKVSRREVEQFYSAYRDSLPTIEETVDISHILKLVTPSESAQDEAYQRILKIKEELEKGADFATLAGTYSEDPASAKRSGDLGLISRGDFVPEFETAAFALNDGEISGIVQTSFGFHIIKMIERRGEKIRTQHILIRVMPSDDDSERVIAELNGLRERALGGEDFSELAVQYSDDENVKQDRGHLGTFEISKMVVPQFTQAISQLKPGEISEPFKTEFGYHIVRLEDRKPGHRLNLEDDWQRIEEFALNFKMEKEYRKWIDELKEEVPIEIKKNI